MRKLGISFVLGLVAAFSALQTPAQSLVPVTLIKAGRLLDPRTGNVLWPAAVLIEEGKIKEVGPPAQVQARLPVGAKTIDLGAATLLPGLIDSHTHLLMAGRHPFWQMVGLMEAFGATMKCISSSGACSGICP